MSYIKVFADDYHSPHVAAAFVQTAGCYADSLCIYSHNADFSAQYALEDTCTWTVTNDAVLVVEQFELEDGFDFLTIAGVGFTGNGEGLDGYPVFAGDEIMFESDFLNVAGGFKICLSDPV